MIDDNTIVTLSPQAILSREFFDDMYDIQEPEERTRVQALAEVRAKELGCLTQFRKTVKQFNALDEQIAQEYTQQKRKLNPEMELDYGSNGRPVTSIQNFVKIIANDPHFSGIKYNLLTCQPEKHENGKIRDWTDADDAELRCYIEKKYSIHSHEKSDDALRIILKQNEYHPVRDMIKSIKWDGQDRIEMFLHEWAKCDDSPYTREASRIIFAGGINRIFNPGGKFDDMVVLIGSQGTGKSTLVRWLAMKDQYFNEVTEFDGPQAVEALQGAWICEVSELLAMTRQKEQESVKSFLTRMNDRRRDPYDRRTSDHKRQCIFVGTTNKFQFITDKTGGRRFYPIITHQDGYYLFDHEQECRDYIAQCWAEAYAKMQTGNMPAYAKRELLDVIRQHQSDATEDDYRVGMIQGYIEDKDAICILDLWQNALGMGEYSKPTKKDSIEIGLIMQSQPGWSKQSRVRRFGSYGPQKWWAREVPDEEDDGLL